MINVTTINKSKIGKNFSKKLLRFFLAFLTLALALTTGPARVAGFLAAPRVTGLPAGCVRVPGLLEAGALSALGAALGAASRAGTIAAGAVR
jgi:hypothetical protein